MKNKSLFVIVICMFAPMAAFSAALAASAFHSTTLQESAPVQTTASEAESDFETAPFAIPSELTRKVVFSGIPGKPAPGAAVKKGERIGEMGNSGRSEVRHLHFEAGIKKDGFATGKPSQSFDFVFDPARFLPRDYIMGDFMEPERRGSPSSR